jgi:hypothetical protein
MFTLLICKQLAPFQHAHLKKIAIHPAPEIQVGNPRFEEMAMFLTPRDAVVRKILCEGTAK